jgi:hypothetical protein
MVSIWRATSCHSGQQALLEASALAHSALLEHQDDGALDSSLLDGCICFCCDVPRRHNLQTRRPEDADQVAPDGGILMGKHHALHTVVRHVIGHGLVGIGHAAPKLVA